MKQSHQQRKLHTRLVYQALCAKPHEKMDALQISQTVNLPVGAVLAILAQLESSGSVESSWEDIDPVKEGRPRRRQYRFVWWPHVF